MLAFCGFYVYNVPRCSSGCVAQLVEQLTLNQWVQGSSPCASTNKYSGHNGRFFVCEKYVFFPRFHAYTTGIHTYINIRLALVQLQC